MKKMIKGSYISSKISLFFLSFLALQLLSPPNTVAAQPLYTDSRWIVNESGERVKLACVNWVSHLEVVVAEGLSKQPADVISESIVDWGFNCVRLTWPLFLATNDSLASTTVRQSFLKLGLTESIAGFQANNPSIIDLSLIKAYEEVVASLGRYNVMVILDNHISKPGWCCSSFDGNGFFGDQYFNPDLWIKGLTKMATIFKTFNNVVGMSLRNELRGPRQNVNDWYKYMELGAEAVHAANPDVLIILSGLGYDKDFSFLQNRPVNLSFSGKLVYEVHWYGFSDGQAWASGNANQVCAEVVNNTMRRAGFLLDKGFPLFVSEFGVDLRGSNVNDNRYLNCFLGWAAELDLDWALWTLAGSYYLREGVAGLNEYYGIYDWNWCEIRNSSFLERISAIQSPLRGPSNQQNRPHKIILHPATGLCVQRKSSFGSLQLGPCSEAEAWSYSRRKTLTIKGTYYCLQAVGVGIRVKLSIICGDPNTIWETISDSKMQLASKLEDNTDVCLDVDENNYIVTNKCKCLSRDNSCDPGSQWFKIIDSSRCTTTGKSFREIDESVSFFSFIAKKFLGSFLAI